MTKLHQLLALEKGAKTKAEKVMTKVYQLFGTPAPFLGMTRSYEPRDDEGEGLPSETQLVQERVFQKLADVTETLSALIDLTISKDAANQNASADIVVGDVTLAAGVPVTTLLTLDKQLVSVTNLVKQIPVLSSEFNWEFDEVSDAYASDEKVTTRSKKVPRNHVMSEATEHHPAQVQMYNEDVIVGDWTTRHYAGGLPAAERNDMIERVEQLAAAVKVARAAANEQEAPPVKIGQSLLGFVFNGSSS